MTLANINNRKQFIWRNTCETILNCFTWGQWRGKAASERV